MIEQLQHFAQGFPVWLQWLAIALIATIPFVEAYTGTLVGVAIGLHPIAAAAAAIAGNAAAVIAIVTITDRVHRGVRASGSAASRSTERPKVRRMFERFGIPGVALIGHPTQISSAALIGFGADRVKVLTWELVSITVWGSVFAVIAGFGFELLIA